MYLELINFFIKFIKFKIIKNLKSYISYIELLKKKKMNSLKYLNIKFRHYYNQLNSIEKLFLKIFITDIIGYSLLLLSFLIATKQFLRNIIVLSLLIFPIISGIITVRNYDFYNLYKLKIFFNIFI